MIKLYRTGRGPSTTAVTPYWQVTGLLGALAVIYLSLLDCNVHELLCHHISGYRMMCMLQHFRLRLVYRRCMSLNNGIYGALHPWGLNFLVVVAMRTGFSVFSNHQ